MNYKSSCLILLIFFTVSTSTLQCKKNNFVNTFKYQHKIPTQHIYLGFSTINQTIVPPKTVLAGYGLLRTSKKSLQINTRNDDLKIKSFILCNQANCNFKNALFIVVIDTLGITGALIYNIKQKILELGIPMEHQFILSTHTHSAPDLIGVWGGVKDIYKTTLLNKIVESAKNTIKKTQKVELYFSDTPTHLPIINRRSPQKKVTPNRLSLMQFKSSKTQQKLLSLMFYSIHPVFLGSKNKLPSADFIGDLERKFQDKFNHPLIYINGAIGNINPPPIDTKNVYNRKMGSYQDIHRFNNQIIKLIPSLLLNKKKLSFSYINIKTEDLLIEPNNLLLKSLNNIGKIKVNVTHHNKIIAPISIISFGNIYKWLSIPGELFKEYEEILYADNLRFNILGLCNDSLGYFMPAEEVGQSKYHVEEKFLLNNQNGVNWLSIIKKNIK